MRYQRWRQKDFSQSTVFPHFSSAWQVQKWRDICSGQNLTRVRMMTYVQSTKCFPREIYNFQSPSQSLHHSWSSLSYPPSRRYSQSGIICCHFVDLTTLEPSTLWKSPTLSQKLQTIVCWDLHLPLRHSILHILITRNAPLKCGQLWQWQIP